MIRVVHVITGLSRAGAEMVLYHLVRTSDRRRFRHEVISLTGKGPLAPRIRELGVPVTELDMKPLSALTLAVPRVARLIRSAAPDVVQTWMYHADLVGGLATSLARVGRPVWGIHQGTHPPGGPRPLTRLGIRMSATLSHRVPKRIVCCAEAARDVHAGFGYASEKMRVIPNGFVVPESIPDTRTSVRQELGLPTSTPLVGRLARFHPQKDYRTLVRACGVVARSFTRANFVFAGLDVTWENDELTGYLAEAGLLDRAHLLGLRQDSDRLTAAMDLVVSSSAFGEAFPLVLGEAMAMGVPVVTTNVGDSARLVGDHRSVVAPIDPDALAQAMSAVLALEPDVRRRRGEAGRARIAERYGLHRMTQAYEALYESVVESS